MTRERVLRARSAAIQGQREGGVGTHVRAALLLGHRHARDRRTLLLRRDRARVIGGCSQQRLPLGRQLGLRAQCRNRREGHRDRTGKAGLGLHRGHVHRRPRRVRRGFLGAPRQRVQFPLHAQRHQFVPGRVELDLVQAVAIAVVGAQDRLVLIGQHAPAQRLGARQPPECDRAIVRPGATLALERLDQRRVRREDVPVLQRRGLVEDLVGPPRGAARTGLHSCDARHARQGTSLAIASLAPATAPHPQGPQTWPRSRCRTPLSSWTATR